MFGDVYLKIWIIEGEVIEFPLQLLSYTDHTKTVVRNFINIVELTLCYFIVCPSYLLNLLHNLSDKLVLNTGIIF